MANECCKVEGSYYIEDLRNGCIVCSECGLVQEHMAGNIIFGIGLGNALLSGVDIREPCLYDDILNVSNNVTCRSSPYNRAYHFNERKHVSNSR